MASFDEILKKIMTGAAIAQAIEPAIQTFSSDHVSATQEILTVVGAGVSAFTNDVGIQNEASLSAQLAASLVPLVFSFVNLFHHAKPAQQGQQGQLGLFPPAPAVPPSPAESPVVLNQN